jgi:hypothetical protein
MRDADAIDMLLKVKPMSNAERQARFRASHPGYNARYRGPSAREVAQKMQAQAQAAAAQAMPIAPAPPQPEAVPAIAWLAA